MKKLLFAILIIVLCQRIDAQINIQGAPNGQVVLAGGVTPPPPYAHDITAPPYNAKCDGSTDDHVAIQACLDNENSCYIPYSPGGTSCSIGTAGVTIQRSGFEFYGNGGELIYSGTDAAVNVAVNISTLAVALANVLVRNTGIYLTAGSTAATAFNLDSAGDYSSANTELIQDWDYGSVNGYNSISCDYCDFVVVDNYISSNGMLYLGNSASFSQQVNVRNSIFFSAEVSCTNTFTLASSTIATNIDIGVAGCYGGPSSRNVHLDNVDVGTITFGSFADNVTGMVANQGGFTGVSGHPASGWLSNYGVTTYFDSLVITVPATSIPSGTPCAGPYTINKSGLLATSTIQITPASDVSTVTGFSPTAGGLYFVAWPTTNTVHYKICNATSSAITPSAATTWNVGAR